MRSPFWQHRSTWFKNLSNSRECFPAGLFSHNPLLTSSLARTDFGWDKVKGGTKIVHGKIKTETRPPKPLNKDGHMEIE